MKLPHISDHRSNMLFPPSKRNEWPTGLLVTLSLLFTFTAFTILSLPSAHQFTIYFSSSSSQTGRFSRDTGCSTIERLVTPQENLMHNMTDEELLWRASIAPTRQGFPFERVPKVAFMFLIRGPLPFLPLWERFFRGHEGLYSVYLHTAPGYNFVASKDSPFYKRQIPAVILCLTLFTDPAGSEAEDLDCEGRVVCSSEEVKWGTISLMDAERRLLANALLDLSNERFVLLSESCIPIYDLSTVYAYLTEATQSFVQCYDKNSHDARGRYKNHMYPNITIQQFRKGSQWVEVNREMALIIVAEIKYYDIFARYCVPFCYPDEHYLPTYLYMFHGRLNSNRTVTWVDWSRRGSHPGSYGKKDITEGFIQAIRSNGSGVCEYNSKSSSICFLFTRKFAPSALEPLMNLTSSIMGF